MYRMIIIYKPKIFSTLHSEFTSKLLTFSNLCQLFPFHSQFTYSVLILDFVTSNFLILISKFLILTSTGAVDFVEKRELLLERLYQHLRGLFVECATFEGEETWC